MWKKFYHDKTYLTHSYIIPDLDNCTTKLLCTDLYKRCSKVSVGALGSKTHVLKDIELQSWAKNMHFAENSEMCRE
jgi:hypothetical protein